MSSLILLGAAFAVGFLRTYVLQQLWNWFLVPAISVEPIGYWMMYGINLIIQLLTEDLSEWTNEPRWDFLFLAIDHCIQPHLKEEFSHDLKQLKETQNFKLGMKVGSALFGYAITLAIGWSVHTLLTSGA